MKYFNLAQPPSPHPSVKLGAPFLFHPTDLMAAARILGHHPPFSFPSFSILLLTPLSPCRLLKWVCVCVCLFLPCALLLPLSRCCVLFCCLYCFALIALLRASVGFLRASFPDLPPFLSCVSPACCVLPCLFSAFVVFSFSRCLSWLAVLVLSLFPSHPFLCVCENPDHKVGSITSSTCQCH